MKPAVPIEHYCENSLLHSLVYTYMSHQVLFHSVAWLLNTGIAKFKLRSIHLTTGINFLHAAN